MKKGIFDRRIPTVFALFILLGGLAITTLLIQQGTFTTSKASPQEEPHNVSIVNITDDSFTVIFTTNSPTVGAVSIENITPPRLFYDKRDSSGQKGFSSHFITVTDLNPKTNYTFNVISNGDIYLDQGKAYVVTTGNATAEKPADTFPLAGSILLPDATPGNDVLVTVKVPEGNLSGAITDSQGNYRIPSNYLRNKNSFEPLSLTPNTEIKIEAKNSTANSQINYSYQPGIIIPPITLSQNYAFTASEESNSAGDETSLLALPTSVINSSSKLTITSPYRGQRFTDSRPQFRGLSIPNSTIRIVISDTQDIEAQVRSDRNGNWAFRPSTIILPGEHAITVQSTNTSGAVQNVASDFEILPSGSQIAESATPSATLIPTKTLTPTKTATPTPTNAVTISPTGNTSLTPTIASTTPTLSVSITLTPTPSPTIFVTSGVPPKATIPPTGNSTATIILTTLSIIFIVTGSAFLFIL